MEWEVLLGVKKIRVGRGCRWVRRVVHTAIGLEEFSFHRVLVGPD